VEARLKLALIGCKGYAWLKIAELREEKPNVAASAPSLTKTPPKKK
jgi:hypothetical protein